MKLQDDGHMQGCYQNMITSARVEEVVERKLTMSVEKEEAVMIQDYTY